MVEVENGWLECGLDHIKLSAITAIKQDSDYRTCWVEVHFGTGMAIAFSEWDEAEGREKCSKYANELFNLIKQKERSMGVYIPKMEKPTDCGYCDFYRWGYCHVKHARVECEDGVDDDCPLVSVTEPHGDLIDRDRTIDRAKVEGARAALIYEPTVIEAEGE